MTSATTASPHEHLRGAEWVQQHAMLWTGRRNGVPIGTIERGRRYTYIDLDGVVHGSFRTLAGAQAAAARIHL